MAYMPRPIPPPREVSEGIAKPRKLKGPFPMVQSRARPPVPKGYYRDMSGDIRKKTDPKILLQADIIGTPSDRALYMNELVEKFANFINDPRATEVSFKFDGDSTEVKILSTGLADAQH